MKKSRNLAALLLAAVMVTGIAGCAKTEGETQLPDSTTAAGGGDTAVTTTAAAGGAAPAETTSDPADYTVTSEAGTINWLGYYDLNTDQTDLSALFESRYNGTIVSELCSNGVAYFERLGTLVAADTSPDLVRYEWRSFPHGISQNLYTNLDSYIDLDSELWSGMKSVADGYSYGGKHYYIPHEVTTSFALNYNKVMLDDEGLDDPMDLYLAGNWDWNAFKDIITEWCNLGENYIGYTGVGAMSFVATTGTKMVDITADGQIINNMKNANVQRCMEFLEGLAKEGFIGTGYVAPDTAFVDETTNGKILFLGMEPTWAFKASKEALFRKDIAEEMKFIPFPKDPQADQYFQATDNFGYMIPSGAKNIDGSLAWITLCRTEKTDPVNIENDKETACDDSTHYYPKCAECKYSFVEHETEDLTACPECGAARKVKFFAAYTEQQYQILQDMKDPAKFGLLFDNVFGFNDDLTNLYQGGSEDAPSLLDSPLFHGASYTQMRETYFNTVESYLEPYREKLLAASSGS